MAGKRIILTRTSVQLTGAEAIGYGAKDTGEMGGGAASAVLSAAGSRLLDLLRGELGKAPSRRVGDVVVTESCDLRSQGTLWICHIISIIKNTPEGAYCPEPRKLPLGVQRALEKAAALNARTVSLSALGTGEGRVKPKDAARLMIGAAVEFLRRSQSVEMDVIFSLPSYRDYEAFRAELQFQHGAPGDSLVLR